MRSVPSQRNAEDIKDEIAEYVSWFLREGTQREVVFVDECGFNVWTARTQGRSARGTRAVRIVEGNRGKNLTLCLAVSPGFGLVHYMFIEGGMTRDLFADFLSDIQALLLEVGIFII